MLCESNYALEILYAFGFIAYNLIKEQDADFCYKYFNLLFSEIEW